MLNSISKEEIYKLECQWKEVVDRLLGLRDAVRVFQTSAPDIRSIEILGPVLSRVYQMHMHRMSFAAMLDDLVYELNYRTEGLAALTPKHPTRMDSTVSGQVLEKPTEAKWVDERSLRPTVATTHKPKKGKATPVVTFGPPEVLRELGKTTEQPEEDWTPEAEATVRGPLPQPDSNRNQ